MKNIKIRKKVENKKLDCVLCQANFEVWLNNANFNPEKEERLRERLFSYCPVCTRGTGKGECN